MSQEEADQCAADQAFICSVPPGVPFFPNLVQTCTIYCPDGLPFSWTVPVPAVPEGGTIVPIGDGGFIKTTLGPFPITINPPFAGVKDRTFAVPFRFKVGGFYIGPVSLDSPGDRHGWTLGFANDTVAPPGLTFSPGVGTMTGTPTTAGKFSFTLMASSAFVQPSSATFTFRVPEIVTLILPDAQDGVLYTPLQLASIGTDAPEVWSITSGILPFGLVLSHDGIISGTPQVTPISPAGVYDLTIQLEDSGGSKSPFSITTSKQFQLTFLP